MDLTYPPGPQEKISKTFMAKDNVLFSASWDRGMWILNSVLLILLGGITITLLVAGIYGMRENTLCGVFVIANSPIPILIVCIIAAWAPRRYQVTKEHILINRLFAKDVKIPLSQIYSIDSVDYKFAFKKSIRIFGSGGGFGIYGDFYSSNLKNFKAYMTRRDRLVLLKTLNVPYVLTPDNPEGFMDAVEKQKMAL